MVNFSDRVVMFLDSHDTVVCSFCYVLQQRCVFLFLLIFKSLQNYSHIVTDITSCEKLESSLHPTLLVCLKLVLFRIKCLKGISHPAYYGDLVFNLGKTKGATNFISSNSKNVKRLRRRYFEPLVIAKSTVLCLVLLQPCTNFS